MPPKIGKCFFRPRTETSGSPVWVTGWGIDPAPLVTFPPSPAGTSSVAVIAAAPPDSASISSAVLIGWRLSVLRNQFRPLNRDHSSGRPRLRKNRARLPMPRGGFRLPFGPAPAPPGPPPAPGEAPAAPPPAGAPEVPGATAPPAATELTGAPEPPAARL